MERVSFRVFVGVYSGNGGEKGGEKVERECGCCACFFFFAYFTYFRFLTPA
jgi:hypothetical protein